MSTHCVVFSEVERHRSSPTYSSYQIGIDPEIPMGTRDVPDTPFTYLESLDKDGPFGGGKFYGSSTEHQDVLPNNLLSEDDNCPTLGFREGQSSKVLHYHSTVSLRFLECGESPGIVVSFVTVFIEPGSICRNTTRSSPTWGV